jgi:hypothetical protein
MAIRSSTPATAAGWPVAARPAGSARFDWTMTGLAGIFLGGLFLDGWAHTHGRVDDTFFTPWHAVLYSGYFLVGLYLFRNLVRNHRQGWPWLEALPIGYEWSWVGVLLWIPGGIADLLWHEIFGFDGGVEALFSPPHLILAMGIGLVVSGPARAAWHRTDFETGGWVHKAPALLSLTFLLSVLTFFTQAAHPLANLWGAEAVRLYAEAGGVEPEFGATGLLFESAILMGIVLTAVRRWALPVGALTVIIGLSSALTGAVYDYGGYPVLPVLMLMGAGVLSDLLLWWLRPASAGGLRLRLFAFGVPVLCQLMYFLGLGLNGGMRWTIHLWMGATLLSGVVGWLLSFVVAPPPGPRRRPLV